MSREKAEKDEKDRAKTARKVQEKADKAEKDRAKTARKVQEKADRTEKDRVEKTRKGKIRLKELKRIGLRALERASAQEYSMKF